MVTYSIGRFITLKVAGSPSRIKYDVLVATAIIVASCPHGKDAECPWMSTNIYRKIRNCKNVLYALTSVSLLVDRAKFTSLLIGIRFFCVLKHLEQSIYINFMGAKTAAG